MLVRSYNKYKNPSSSIGWRSIMEPRSAPETTTADRETLVQQRLQELRELAEAHLRGIAETLVDTPPEQLFGAVEFKLRDQVHRLAAHAHQVTLDRDKKRGTLDRAESVPPAKPMPDTSAIDPATS
jgi:hypothetical protein